MQIFKRDSCVYHRFVLYEEQRASQTNASTRREGKSPPVQTERDGIMQERIIINPRKQRRGECSFVGCQWGWQRLRSIREITSAARSLDRRGFKKPRMITGKHADSTWKRGACASIHLRLFFSPWFLLPLNCSKILFYSKHTHTHTHTHTPYTSRLW